MSKKRSIPQTRTVQIRLSLPIYSALQKAAADKGISLSVWLSNSITNSIMANAKQAVENASAKSQEIDLIKAQVEKGRKILGVDK